MDDVFLGEIRYVAFDFAPRGWALCNGQTLPISQNTALFSLLGTTYGGDGRSNFQLPNLQGRVAVGQGQGPGLSLYDLGQNGGDESVTLGTAQIPPHSHGFSASGANGSANDPTHGVYAKPVIGRGTASLYSPSAANAQAAADAVGIVGNNQPHDNRAPGLAMTAVIALEGIFPSRP